MTTHQERWLIVGAGPAGIHLAHLLAKRGHRDVVLLEQGDRFGGKSETLEFNGHPQEMGTCYLHPGYALLQSLLEEFNITESFKPGGREGRRDMFSDLVPMNSGGHVPGLGEWLLQMVRRHKRSQWFQWAPNIFQAVSVLRAVRKYKKLHRSLLGEYQYTLPSEPSDEGLKAIDMTFLQWLEGHGLQALIPMFKLTTTAQGYGSLETVPTLYGLWWNTPLVIDAFMRSSRDKDQPVLSMLEHGYSAVWNTLVEQHDMRIELGVDIQRIDRSDGIQISALQNGERREFSGTRLVLACNLKSVLATLSDPEPEEIELFSNLVTQELTSTLVRTAPQSGANCIAYWPDVLRTGNPGRLYSRRDTALCKNPDAAPDENVWACYQYSDHFDPAAASLRLLQLRQELANQGVEVKEILAQRHWAYFTRFTQDGINRRYPWRLWRLQGHANTWYAGASACFESVNDIMNYNQMLVDRLLIEQPVMSSVSLEAAA